MASDEALAGRATAAVERFVPGEVVSGVAPVDAHATLMHALLDHAEELSNADELYLHAALRYEDFVGPSIG